MTRQSQIVSVFIGALIVFGGYLFWLGANGYVSPDNLELRGMELLAREGAVPFSVVVTAYPPFQLFMTIGFGAIFPWLGLATPGAVGVVLAGVLVASWYGAFREYKIGPLAALVLLLLVGLNPLFLRAVSEGPTTLLLHLGFWVTLLGALDMRSGRKVNDLILVSLGLALIAFSQPFGMLVLLASLPFLTLIMPEDRLRDSPFALYLVVLFPTAVLVFGTFFFNWVFEGDPLAFFPSLKDWINDAVHQRGDFGSGPAQLARDAYILVAALVATAPFAVSLYLRARRKVALRGSIIASFGTLIAAILLGEFSGIFLPLAALLGLCVNLNAGYAGPWMRDARNGKALVGFAVVSWMAGAAVVLALPETENQRWLKAMSGQEVEMPDAEIFALAKAIETDEDVLFDAQTAPEVVALLGSVGNIHPARSMDFLISNARRRIESDVVVVRGAAGPNGPDKIGQAFPQLYEQGMTGFVSVYQGPNWRVYRREFEG